MRSGRGTADRVAIREGYIRSAYEDADEKLHITRELMGGNPTTFAGSDHGFAPQSLAVNARKVLLDKTVSYTVPAAGGQPATPQTVSLHASGLNATANCRGNNLVTAAANGAYVSGDLTKACWAGGTIQVYVSPTLPTGLTYEAVRTAVADAFNALNTGGKQVTQRIMKKEELRNVDGSDSLHPNRSGDVVVVLMPPYQSDAGTANQPIFAVALLRPARLPAELRRPEEQHQHARGVRDGRPGHQAQGQRQGPPRDRRRADDRLPDGHPGPAERARPDPLRRSSRAPRT